MGSPSEPLRRLSSPAGAATPSAPSSPADSPGAAAPTGVPSPPAERKEFRVARSFVLRAAPTKADSDPTQGFLPVYSPSLMAMRNAASQQKQIEARASSPGDRSQQGSGAGIMRDYPEPPFNLDRLTTLLFQSPEYYMTVDQLATDAAGLGWELVDREPGEGGPPTRPEQGEIDPDLTSERSAAIERQLATALLRRMTFDFSGRLMELTEFSKMVISDRDATGNGHLEPTRDLPALGGDPQAAPITGLIHAPARLIRRHISGRAYCQLGDHGTPVAFFRPWGSELRGAERNPEYYLSPDEVGILQSAHPENPERWQVGQPKPELVDFRHYHPGERLYGIPPIIASLQAVFGNILSRERNLRFFLNRGMPDWLVMVKSSSTIVGDPDKESQVEEIMGAIQDHLKYLQEGEDYRVLTIALSTGEIEVTFEKLNTELKDADFQQYQSDNSDTIFRVYRMLPNRLGIIETAQLGAGSGESQTETYKRAQVDPRQHMLEEFYNAVLDSNGFMRVRFKFNEIDLLDEEREMRLFSAAVASRALTLNEARGWLSRIVKDQDFAPEDAEFADVPMMLIDLQIAGLLGQAATVSPFAAGYAHRAIAAMAGADPGAMAGSAPGGAPPGAAEDMAQLRPAPANGNGGGNGVMGRMRTLRDQLLGQGVGSGGPTTQLPGVAP